MSTTDPLLSLDDVEVHFGDESALMEATPERIKERFGWTMDRVKAVDGVSLDLEENDIVAVVGESGSGKTTLGKTAVGLQEPTAGQVKYRGHDFWEVKERTRVDDLYFEDIRRELQIVHQDPEAALNPYRTLMTMLKEPLKRWYPEMSNADRRERVLGLFNECGLKPPREYEDRYPHELSGGEKQRVVLVRALLSEPDVILADEPVSALDSSLQIELMDLMIQLQDEFDTSFLFITHSLENAKYMASKGGGRLAVMYLGKVVEVGTVEEVLENPKHPYTRVLKWATVPMHPDEAREAMNKDIPLQQIDAPEPKNLPSGCRFHTRCPKAREACTAEVPELYPQDDAEHRAACYRELSNHEYWDSDPLHEEELDIPE